MMKSILNTLIDRTPRGNPSKQEKLLIEARKWLPGTYETIVQHLLGELEYDERQFWIDLALEWEVRVAD